MRKPPSLLKCKAKVSLANLSLPHHFGILPQPLDKHELHALAFLVVRVLDSRVRVGHLVILEGLL